MIRAYLDWIRHEKKIDEHIFKKTKIIQKKHEEEKKTPLFLLTSKKLQIWKNTESLFLIFWHVSPFGSPLQILFHMVGVHRIHYHHRREGSCKWEKWNGHVLDYINVVYIDIYFSYFQKYRRLTIHNIRNIKNQIEQSLWYRLLKGKNLHDRNTRKYHRIWFDLSGVKIKMFSWLILIFLKWFMNRIKSLVFKCIIINFNHHLDPYESDWFENILLCWRSWILFFYPDSMNDIWNVIYFIF